MYCFSCICDLLWYIARHFQSYSALHWPSWRSYAIYVLTYMTSGFEPITVLDIILQLWDIIPSVSFLRKPDRVKPSIKCPLQETLTSWCDIPVISWYRSWQSHPSFFFSFLLLTGGVIAAIGIGAVLGVLIFGALVWYIIRCCKKSKTSAETKVFLETQPA